ncbi:enoyl-CoA hydratase/isomerase family protein [Ferviditalea candida]|uniref:Enoyl-CoA hydratase-related protein n=1 Tax=Ferviditalea candida TaxID=3108399 RepID=A0ABU5ZN46_9BACL|nr:enoyl-CoA hydratase-related protein [Paenibacillaceae bacterium T2]
MEYEVLEYRVEQSVAVVTLNRPPYNPLNSQIFMELVHVLETIEDDDQVRAVILTGKGDKAFAAGADVHEMKGLDRKGIAKMARLARAAFNSMELLSKPIIGAVNGLALGGGCELALACDLRICSEHAKFALPELKLGIIPGAGGTQRLPRIIGQARAKEMILFGETVDARKAYEIGLVNKTLPMEELYASSMEWALKLAENPPIAMQAFKRSINTGMNVDLESALLIEDAHSTIAFLSEDRKEGMTAFSEKRKPNFVGR